MKNIYLKSHIHKIIQNDLQNNMLNHSYMLISTDKLLINEFARLVAQEIMCEQNCGVCPTCLKIQNHNHSDVIEYPQNDKGIMSADADKIVDDSYILPMEGDRKVYILHNFDESNIVVQNKLLKTIEEPSKSVVFLITCSNDSLVLPTIRSRCKKLTEPVLDEGQIVEYLMQNHNLEGDNANKIAKISDGNLTLAVSYATDSKLLDMRNLAVEILTSMQNSGDVLKYSVAVQKYKGAIETFLNVMLDVFHSSLRERMKGRVTTLYNEKSTVGAMRVIENAIKKIKSNCNTNSVVEGVLLGILEERYKCQK